MQWLDAWVPCRDSGTFEIAALQPDFETYTNGTTVITGYGNPIPFTHHSDVCEPVYTADGRCPRSVVSATTQHDRSDNLGIGR